MPSASTISLTLIGWAAALFLWFAAPVSLHETSSEPLPGKGNFFTSATLHYVPGQSAVIRIAPSAQIEYPKVGRTVVTPSACIEHIAVNAAITILLQHCQNRVMTVDISPWLHAGTNQLEVAFHAFKANGAVHLRSMHSTPIMLAIIYYFYFGLIIHLLLHIDWQAKLKRLHLPQMLLLTLGLASALYMREALMDIYSNDYRAFINGWFEAIRIHRGSPYIVSGANYTPLYIYMLALFDRCFPTMSMLHAVKWLSFIGEAFAGFWLWRVVKLCSRHPLLPPAAVTLMWLAPSVVLNSAAMSQCDIWWVGMLFAAIYYLGRQRPSLALCWGGLAFAFKLQAIFLSPLLLILVIEGIIPWRRLWILPAVYLLTCLPAWFEGVPLAKLLLVYWKQFHTYGNMTETGNLYAWLQLPFTYDTARNIGVVFSIAIAAGLVAVTYRRWPRQPTLLHCLLLAALFSTLMPFILPKMINRYFLAGDVFTLAFATLRPRWFLLPLLMQCASTLTFQSWQIDIAQRLTGLNDWHRFHIAALLYAAAIALLCWMCKRYLWRKDSWPEEAR